MAYALIRSALQFLLGIVYGLVGGFSTLRAVLFIVFISGGLLLK
jgi:hypothetical protein